jgi:YVTN family beta-propeller protein
MTFKRWLLAAALPALLAAGTQAPSGYHLVRRVVLGGEGKWDYLTFDPVGHRLFVTHGTEVLVVSPDSGKVVGAIPGTEGVHGVALAQDLGRGFTSNGKSATVTEFDLRSLKPLARIPTTGQKPDAILYDSVTHRVFTFNGGSDNATAIDAVTGRVVGTVPLGGAPEFAVTDGRGRLYVNLEDKSEVVSVDPASLAVRSRWPLTPCEAPSGMAMDRATRRLFVGCHNRMMAMMDADNGKVLATVPIGSGVDANAFDSGTGLAFSSNGDGTLTVVDARSAVPRVVENVQTEPGARTMALDPGSHTVYLVTSKFGPAPAPTAAEPKPRPPTIPGTFALLVYTR